MIRVLVPIDAFSHLTLSATYFALEFAKRNPAKVFFLILERPRKKRTIGSGHQREMTNGQFYLSNSCSGGGSIRYIWKYTTPGKIILPPSAGWRSSIILMILSWPCRR